MSKQTETPVITATHVGSDQYQFGCWHHLGGWLEYRASNRRDGKAQATAEAHADEQHPGVEVRIAVSGLDTYTYTGAVA